MAWGLLSLVAMDLSFDRGTLVLPAGVQSRTTAPAAGLVFDPRVEMWRAPAYLYRAIQAELRQRGPCRDLVRPRLREQVRIACPPLRPYQADALCAWEVAARRGIVVLPTGSGKTRLAVAAMARLGASALVLVPTRALLAQWRAALAEHSDYPVGVVGDGERELRSVTVATFESAYRQMDRFGDRFALLVVDEVHHFGGGLRDEALEMATAPFRLGLTATPPEAEAARLRLWHLVGPVVWHLGIPDLAGTHLAPYRRRLVPVELQADERARYEAGYQPFLAACRAFARSAPGAGWTDLVRILGQSSSGRELLQGRLDAVRVVAQARGKLEVAHGLLRRHVDDRTLVFTGDNDAAYRVSRELLIPAITCEIQADERRSLLDAMRRGELRALVSARVLNEGIDLPEASVAVILGGRHGTREHVQRVGRVLRPQEGKTALVYEVVAVDTFEVRHAERRHQPLVSSSSP